MPEVSNQASLKNEAEGVSILCVRKCIMPVKSSKSKSNVKGKPMVRKAAVATGAGQKSVAKAKPKVAINKAKAAVKEASLSKSRAPAGKPIEVTHAVNLANQIRQPVKPAVKRSGKRISAANSNLFTFMKTPRLEYAFEVGDTVEVFCDHEKESERVRGWVKGIVVQVDNKLVAVQFRSNVYLTDGWMVPDRILWFPLNSEHIRPMAAGKKPAFKKDVIPDY
jgi:hypothetical protein